MSNGYQEQSQNPKKSRNLHWRQEYNHKSKGKQPIIKLIS